MQNKYWNNEQWNNLASPSNIGAAASTHTHTKVDITDFAHKSSHAVGGSDPLTPADIGAAPNPIMVTATLSTTWEGSGPYTQSVTVSGVTSTNNITVSLASMADETQRNAARDALLFATAQATNSITVTADGDKPIVDLPIQVLILGG